MPSSRLRKGKQKRGRPRKENTALLTPSGKRARKHRAKKALQEMLRVPTSSFFCNAPLPAALCLSPPYKRGRPLLPSESLTPRGAETRRYRARRCVRLLILYLAAEHVECAEHVDNVPAEPKATNADIEPEEAEEAEARRVEVTPCGPGWAARQLLMLAEHNPEGTRGLKRAEQTKQLVVKTGVCVFCMDPTDTFTPCCGVVIDPDLPPKWLCAPCLKMQQLVYARAPITSNEGRQYESSHLGRRCPHCRKDDVFTNGVRALWRAV